MAGTVTAPMAAWSQTFDPSSRSRPRAWLRDSTTDTGSGQIDRPRAQAPAFVAADDLDVPAFLRNR